MDWKKFWPTLIPLLAILVDAFSGSITQFLTAHPSVGLVLGALITAIANVITPKKP